MALLVDGPLAAVGARHHRLVGAEFGDHWHQPCQFSLVVVEVRQQLHRSPPSDGGVGYRLGAGVSVGRAGQVATDERSQAGGELGNDVRR